MIRRAYLNLLRYLSAALLLWISTSAVAADGAFTICVHPYKSATKLLASYAPLAKYLSEKLGDRVDVHIAENYASHIKSVGDGKYGIGYMGPASYINLVEKYGKKRLLARQEVDGKPTFRGKILVRQDSTIQTLSDLKGKRFAFGDPNSTMSHLVPRYMLIEAGVTEKDLAGFQFLGNHTNVALGVLTGDFDAGGVKESVFYKYKERGLRELATTPELSEHLFLVSDNFPDSEVDKLRQALLQAHQSEQGRKALASIKKNISALVPVEDADYDNLRKILSTLKSQGVLQ